MQRLEEKRRQEASEKFGLPAGSAVRWVLTEGPDKRHRIAVGAVAKPTKDDPKPRKGEEMVKLPPQWPGEQSEANVTWPVIVRLRHTAFTSEDEAKAMLAKWEENMEKATKETESGDARHGGHDKETESGDAKHGGQDAATESGDTKDGGQDGASTEAIASMEAIAGSTTNASDNGTKEDSEDPMKESTSNDVDDSNKEGMSVEDSNKEGTSVDDANKEGMSHALNNPKVEHDAKENERPHVGVDAKEEGGPQDGMQEGGSERAMASTREKECADDGKEEVGPETQALWAVDSK